MSRNNQDIAASLNICLEWILEGSETLESALAQFPKEASELRPLLESALWLSAQAHTFDPQAGRLEILQGRLVSRIERESAARPSNVSPAWLESLLRKRAFVLRSALTLILVLALSIGSLGVAQASQVALPGDGFYPVKIYLEDAQLALSLSPVQDARLHNQFVQRRIGEIQSLVRENRFEFLSHAISTYQKEVNEAIQDLNEVAQRFPDQSILLANELQTTLNNQASVFSVLVEIAPNTFHAELARLKDVTDRGISATSDVLTSSENKIRSSATPMLTETLNAGQLATPENPPGAINQPPSTSTPVPALSIPGLTTQVEAITQPPSSILTATIPAIDTGDHDGGNGVIPARKPTKTPKPTKTSRPIKKPRIRD